MVRDHELSPGLGRALEQLAVRGDARDDQLDLLGARHLKPVRARVVELAGLEQFVQVRDQVWQLRHWVRDDI